MFLSRDDLFASMFAVDDVYPPHLWEIMHAWLGSSHSWCLTHSLAFRFGIPLGRNDSVQSHAHIFEVHKCVLSSESADPNLSSLCNN